MKNIFLYFLLLSSTIQAQDTPIKWIKGDDPWPGRFAKRQKDLADSLMGNYQDTAYWNHITKHERFKFIKSDTSITGKVEKIFTERDGDLHVIVRTEKGIIRCEIICYQRVNEACNGFWNHTKRPKIGNIVTVYGDYVYDRWHRWHELHPVTKIEVILPRP